MRVRGAEKRRRILALVAVFVLALLAGAVVGWFVHRWSNPTMEERARDAMEQMTNEVQKMTR